LTIDTVGMKSLFKIYGKKLVKPATFSLAECAKKGGRS
jgi:hypothetical protein